MNWDSVVDWLDAFQAGPWDTPIRIALIAIIAIIASKLSTVAINKMVRRATNKNEKLNIDVLNYFV